MSLKKLYKNFKKANGWIIQPTLWTLVVMLINMGVGLYSCWFAIIAIVHLIIVFDATLKSE